MSEYAHLIHELDLIEAFGFWLKHTLPGWSISRPAIERVSGGEQHPIFVLYDHGVAVGTYNSPMEALARIGEDRLTEEYMFLTASADAGNDSGAHPAPRP